MTREKAGESEAGQWIVVERPGYLGSGRIAKYQEWNKKYGENNWRISWEFADGRKADFEAIFQYYFLAYLQYFVNNPGEAAYISDNFSHAYDENKIGYEDAFDPYFLYEKAGFSNQFHHVALNLALAGQLGYQFRGKKPLQVRLGKAEEPEKNRPKGWKWHPGRIPCTDPAIIPKNLHHERKWWESGSIEDLYQSSKVLEVKKS